MTLDEGTTLGSFEISDLIGVGGMGEVYRAKDLRLGREVAIKVLPEVFAKDKDRLARFEREAKLLAALNHPNIAGIYELGNEGETHFLAMELVEGQTLSEKLKNGAMGVEEALPLFAQIAEALENAHEQGIVHRDLKPANIKVTEEGRVKVLDFGLAKAFEAPSASSSTPGGTVALDSDSAGVTGEGKVLGTPAYMSPEQASGKPVDKRADIWAFGCCLYEALTGKRPFQGDSATQLLARILEREPDWEALPKATPGRVRILLWRCMQKDPRRRLRDIGEARFEISETSSDSAARFVTPGPTTARAGIPIKAAIAGAVACLILGAIGAVAVLRRPAAPDRAPSRIAETSIVLDEAPVAMDQTQSFALSPDGRRLVYTARAGDIWQLYVRDLDDRKSRPLRDTEHGHDPFFSPDGGSIGYFDARTAMLKTVSIEGGAPIEICQANYSSRSGSWSEDGTIVFPSGWFSGLYRVSADGGLPETLTTLDPARDERTHRYPHVLPGGKAVLFMAGDNRIQSFDDADIMVYSFETKEIKRLIRGGAIPRYAPTGHLVYARAGQLMAASFDPERIEVTGPAKVVLDGVVTSGNIGAAQYDFSNDGTLVYMPGGPEAYFSRIQLVDRSGEKESLDLAPRNFRYARFSPNGAKLSFWIDSANAKIWTYELNRRAPPRVLPLGPGNHNDAIWDGPDAVIFSTVQGLERRIARFDLTASEPAQVLLETSDAASPSALSPDRKWLIVERSGGMDGATGLWMMPVDGSGELELFHGTTGNESNAAISPDGRWVAYQSDETARNEIYVVGFPEPGGPNPISSMGGSRPVWSPKGDEIFYQQGKWMMTVKVRSEAEGEARFGEPEPLFEFETIAEQSSPTRPFDVSPDGQQFVMIEPLEPAGTRTELHVVFNWFEQLKRLVPTGEDSRN